MGGVECRGDDCSQRLLSRRGADCLQSVCRLVGGGWPDEALARGGEEKKEAESMGWTKA